MSFQQIRYHVEGILRALQLDPAHDPELRQTPDRVAKWYLEFFGQLDREEEPDVVPLAHEGDAEEMILVTGLPFYSMCAHHLLPFFGEAHIAYVPERALLGLGSIGRLLEHYARRPQLQERLTEQIAEALMRAARPRGAIVLLKARQLCMEMRGAKKPGWVMTSAARGCFRESPWREEFFRRVSER
ncbi:MAG: GTP cyclohydrolase I [Blastocatellia bacterium]|nr:GTP cyclohydrolase I [Blastocatellia bacterium]MCS7157249.1 GTP cyclohydrolase I [Blastocatellia bacterium]MCX7752062.1 GTP cyclohydrolase I [Blastocatellia bacterium]MDW8167168.1 GTP cyclohydrolase I [Acidobacteriota bacterium]MDW8256493.1 GTP cyclohydrolase I [Acidobacteriota bacterium]